MLLYNHEHTYTFAAAAAYRRRLPLHAAADICVATSRVSLSRDTRPAPRPLPALVLPERAGGGLRDGAGRAQRRRRGPGRDRGGAIPGREWMSAVPFVINL